jgi:glutathione synthase/RimK-type ligase-like ATP-grasp enzyme
MNPTPECCRTAEQLNRECQCITLDREALRAELQRGEAGADLYGMIAEGRPHLFSDSAVFLGEDCIRRMAEVIAAVERVVALPAWPERVLAWAPAAARYAPKAAGVFLGYDFHQGSAGPQLIEINTNAGGGLLNAALAQAQQACCAEVAAILPGRHHAETLELDFFDMFLDEWRAERGAAALRTIAIVDEHPAEQYLYPEFVLFQKLFGRHGIEAAIADPADLRYEDGALRHNGLQIDLVYNRLTDFGLEAPSGAALRDAYLAGAVVLTPHPRAHALYADKRNLALLTDEQALRELGVDAATQAVLLGGIPRTEIVRREDAESLWQRRKQLFFKPSAGYGSKAAYRGDKLTKRVFEEILDGAYVAQALVPPSERHVGVGEETVGLKLDLRNYAYRGEVQLVTARLYQGQTTNFRTPGGGFAPVLTVPCAEDG